MPHLDINFDDVPDEILPIEAGVYTLLVESADVEPNKKGDALKVVAKLKIDDEDSPFHGRYITDHMSTKLAVGLKQLIRSAGLVPTAGGLDTNELVGCHVRARVKSRTYRDQETGEVRETSAIAEYLYEEDENSAAGG